MTTQMTTTFRNTEYLILVNHDEEGNEQFAHGQVSRVQVAQDGVTVFPASPIDFEHATLGNLLADFNEDLMRENAMLKARLSKDSAERQQQIDTLNADIAALTTQLQTAQSAATANANAVAQLTALQTANAALESRVATLLTELPFDPRKIRVTAFLDRLTKEEMLMLSDSDAGVTQIAGMLRQWAVGDETGPWPIDMECEPFADAMAFLVQTGRLTEDRVAQITVDATREESPAAQ